jgi:hypothetical protein
MSGLGLVAMLVVLGFAAWLVNTKFPVSGTIKMIINVVLIVIAIILCLVAFGVWDEVRNMKVPHI